ncbi:BMP and activin membrane-bound inhibitor homolog [Antedon mediterranea]|uniref:BMP and activin membrane-bound inhibitor homolog n=1 Tax=Antedon mediterranea TaxID=105859 RepID=UPI003AF72C5B
MILHIPWEFAVLSLLSLIIAKVEGEIHCYCNAPSCVGYSYMCKSDTGCYTEYIEDSIHGSRSYTHGCVEDLAVNLCQTRENINNTETLTVLCCTSDMCNYDISVDRPITIPERDRNELDSRNTQPYHSVNRTVWFRAAVIAVPIGGACILFILILLAARMLKNEEKHFERFNSGHKLPQYRPTSMRQEFWDANNVKNITITDNNLDLLQCKLNNTYIWKLQHEAKQQNRNDLPKNFSMKKEHFKMNIDKHDMV